MSESLFALSLLVSIFFITYFVFSVLFEQKNITQQNIFPKLLTDPLELFLWQSGYGKNEVKGRVNLLLLVGCVIGGVVWFTPFIISCVLIIGYLIYVLLKYQRFIHRQNQVQLELVDLSSSLSLAVRGGQDFWSALSLYSQLSKSFLAHECREILRSMKLGSHQENAFDEVVKRYPITQEFFSVIGLSQKHGTPLSHVLSIQSDKWRQHAVTRVEAHINRLPVLLLGPLALCIFPNVFLALLGPFLVDLS